MSKSYSSNDEFFHDMQSLIETWCDRRCLSALAILLPAYTSFNGMTDGWGELAAALKAFPLSKGDLRPEERETIADLKRAADNAISGR